MVRPLGANLSEPGSGDWLPPGMLSLLAQHPQPYCLQRSLLAQPLQRMHSYGRCWTSLLYTLAQDITSVGRLAAMMHQAIFCCQTAFETATAVWTGLYHDMQLAR